MEYTLRGGICVSLSGLSQRIYYHDDFNTCPQICCYSSFLNTELSSHSLACDLDLVTHFICTEYGKENKSNFYSGETWHELPYPRDGV